MGFEEERVMVMIFYERLLAFCFRYPRIGHLVTKCSYLPYRQLVDSCEIIEVMTSHWSPGA